MSARTHVRTSPPSRSPAPVHRAVEECGAGRRPGARAPSAARGADTARRGCPRSPTTPPPPVHNPAERACGRCPQGVIHRLEPSTGGYPQVYAQPRPGSGARRGVWPNVASTARNCGVVPVSGPRRRLLPCPHLRRSPIMSTDDGLFPVDNSAHSPFARVGRECAGARKKIFDEFPEVIHRRGSKSVDNLVDNLWTTAPRLWVTRGVPVDEGGGHPITRSPAAVENLGKTCGRSCGRTVENLGTTRFIHRPPKLCTGFSTSPVDKNSGADLVKQGLSTVSTGPTTTAHLDQPSVASKRQRGKSVDNSPGATRPTSRQRQRGNPGNVWSRPCPPPPGSER